MKRKKKKKREKEMNRWMEAALKVRWNQRRTSLGATTVFVACAACAIERELIHVIRNRVYVSLLPQRFCSLSSPYPSIWYFIVSIPATIHPTLLDPSIHASDLARPSISFSMLTLAPVFSFSSLPVCITTAKSAATSVPVTVVLVSLAKRTWTKSKGHPNKKETSQDRHWSQ